jgi:hypothetical protein
MFTFISNKKKDFSHIELIRLEFMHITVGHVLGLSKESGVLHCNHVFVLAQ